MAVKMPILHRYFHLLGPKRFKCLCRTLPKSIEWSCMKRQSWNFPPARATPASQSLQDTKIRNVWKRRNPLRYIVVDPTIWWNDTPAQSQAKCFQKYLQSFILWG